MGSNAIEAFSLQAADYDAGRRMFIPPFEDYYGAAIACLAYATRPLQRVLELGAGTGILTGMVRQVLPDAHLVVTDGSEAMLARNPVCDDPNATVEVLNFRDPLPDGPFDAIVSGLAIHHLEHDEQADLYRRVHDVLAPGGVFVNAEIVTGPGPLSEAAYDAWHERAVRGAGATDEDWAAYEVRRAEDRCATVAQLLRWLADAGFGEADCLFKQRIFAVVSGVR